MSRTEIYQKYEISIDVAATSSKEEWAGRYSISLAGHRICGDCNVHIVASTLSEAEMRTDEHARIHVDKIIAGSP